MKWTTFRPHFPVAFQRTLNDSFGRSNANGDSTERAFGYVCISPDQAALAAHVFQDRDTANVCFNAESDRLTGLCLGGDFEADSGPSVAIVRAAKRPAAIDPLRPLVYATTSLHGVRSRIRE